jgi:tetratricopeptide (TPR) repeat protein
MRGGLQKYLTLEQPSEEYIDCYRTRGIALSHLNKYKEGIADVSIAIKLRKDDPKLLYERGYLEEKAGMKKDAVPDYHRAGMIYADTSARAQAQECVAKLDGLGAKAEADAVRLKMAPKTKKSDLPK